MGCLSLVGSPRDFHLPCCAMLLHITPWHSCPSATPKGLTAGGGSPGGCDPIRVGSAEAVWLKPPMSCSTQLVQDIQSGNEGCWSSFGRGESALPLGTTGDASIRRPLGWLGWVRGNVCPCRLPAEEEPDSAAGR